MSRIVESLYRISGIELNEDFDYLDLDSVAEEVTPLIKALDEHCIENWKEHANAPVPESNPEKINVYDFDEDEYEPLRPKLYDCKPVADGLYIYWLGQEGGYISDGMYNEIERWAKTIRDKYCKGEHTKIFLKTEDRDGTESDEAVIEI